MTINLNEKSVFLDFEGEKLNDLEMDTISSGVTTNQNVKNKILEDYTLMDSFFNNCFINKSHV